MCLELRDFLGRGTFMAETQKVLDKIGCADHPTQLQVGLEQGLVASHLSGMAQVGK